MNKSTMKRSASIIAAFVLLSFSSFAQNKKNDQDSTATKKKAVVMYHCPMHCLADKKYNKPGTCQKCSMRLVKVETK